MKEMQRCTGAGRDFREQDNPAFTPDPKEKPDPKDKATGPRVIIVNESFAKRFFANRSEGVFRWMGKRLSARFTGPSQRHDRVICRVLGM